MNTLKFNFIGSVILFFLLIFFFSNEAIAQSGSSVNIHVTPPLSLDPGSPAGKIRFKVFYNGSMREGGVMRATIASAPINNFVPFNLSFETGTTELKEQLRILSNGNIGVNTSLPSARFEVQQYSNSLNTTNSLLKITGGLAENPSLFTIANANNGSALLQVSLDGDFTVHQGDIVVEDKNILIADGHLLVNTTEVVGNHVAFINGSLLGTEFWVKTYQNWPDYVFDSSYKLPTLLEKKKFIQEHGHLYGMPSAKEVALNGFSLVGMQANLLKEIEELTLISIHEKEENERKMDEANARILELETRLAALEKLLLGSEGK